MEFLENQSLKPYNTFGIDQSCRWFCELNHINDTENIYRFLNEFPQELLIIGGGSNLLLTKNFDGLVVKNNLKGIEILSETEDHAIVKANAGEVWHELVLWTIANGFSGLENLSLIPGCVGAAPMQNIGAYGVEIKDTFHQLEAMHLDTLKLQSFTAAECEFGYRESVFKNSLKGQFLITSVSFKLSKKPVFKTTYGAIQEELTHLGVSELSTQAISQAVINIRSSKLPDPKKIGNAGSFFKNPVVDKSFADKLKLKHPEAPVYPVNGSHSKLAAGWLIEQAGWKGKNIENRYGVHQLQALVLVNYGGATGKEIYQLSEDIVQNVQAQFGVTLEREVNIL